MFSNTKYYIIDPSWQKNMFPIVNIGSSLFFIYWCYNNWSVPSILKIFLLSLSFGIIISLFAHRAWSHKSWIPNKGLNLIGLLIFTLLLTGTSIGYVSTHRQHHRYSDSDMDPHSPYYMSRWKIQFMLWRLDMEPFYVKDLIRDVYHIWFLKWYWVVNFAFLILLYFIGIEYLMFWIATIGLTHLKHQSVNTFCHRTPSVLLPTTHNSSISNVLLLILTNPGECWHKNHHDNPKSYSFSIKWYEIDIPALIIKLFCKLRIAKIL